MENLVYLFDIPKDRVLSSEIAEAFKKDGIDITIKP